MTRLRTLLGIGLGLAVVAGAGWYITTQMTTTQPTAARAGRFGQGQATPVGIATAAKGDIPIVINALGTVTPFETVTITTQIAGQLAARRASPEGQTVKAGDLHRPDRSAPL